jgi:hypothetical protein
MNEKVAVVAMWMRLIYEVLWLLGLAALVCALAYSVWTERAVWPVITGGILWLCVMPISRGQS